MDRNDDDRNDDFPNCITPQDPSTLPEPTLFSCQRIDSNVRDNEGVTTFYRGRVLVKTTFSTPFRHAYDDPSGGDNSDNSNKQLQNVNCAYLIGGELRDSIFGNVYHGKVLRRASGPTGDVWQMTGEDCAIKEMPWERVRIGRARNLAENPEDEMAVMQYLRRYWDGINGRSVSTSDAMRETKVVMSFDCLFDGQNLYNITPFCDTGEVLDLLQHDRAHFTEEESRYLLNYILDGLECLQSAGLCHRDISLENILVHQGMPVIIDMGMCFRIPYLDGNVDDADVPGSVNHQDIRAQRCLISRRPHAGKAYYMSPEILSEEPFDGHAVDMWAVGVCLFMMLTGKPPWQRAAEHDDAFRNFSGGNLVHILRDQYHLGLSEHAMDILQRMMLLDPRDRISLQQVRNHPWMHGPVHNPVDN